MIASWWAAVGMLTRLPAGSATGDRRGSRWFGLVGAVVGAGAFVPLVALGTTVPSGAAILGIGTMAILSGAMHLDGLADTADALLAMGHEAAERARKDPSIGTGGATALLLVLGLEVASLATVASTSGALVAGLACVAGGAVSRAVPVVVARIARSRATGDGLGAAFGQHVGAVDAAIGTVTALTVAVIAAVVAGSAPVLVGCLVGVTAGVALGLAVVRLRGQLDGDGLGTSVELSFAATLMSVAAIGRWPAA